MQVKDQQVRGGEAPLPDMKSKALPSQQAVMVRQASPAYEASSSWAILS